MNRAAMTSDLRGLLNQLPVSITIGSGSAITAALSPSSMETALLAYGSVENYRTGVIVARDSLDQLPAKDTKVTLTVPGRSGETLYVIGCREIDAITAVIDLRN
jgi:hypothetical protein